MKKYLEQNVYGAAQERIKFIFDNFEKIYVSFSGGKDSGVMLNMCIDYMRENGIKKKIGCLFIDLEGQYSLTIEYSKNLINSNLDILEPYWVCLPLNLRNATSVFNPFWTCWDEDNKDKWIRALPPMPYVVNDTGYFPFYKDKMEFEEFAPEFGKWFSHGKKTACLVGIRSDESLNRFRTIASKTKQTYNGKQYSTKIDDNLYNFYPIYDWTTQDIWIGNARNRWEYNKLYDLFYQAGISIHNQRICQPFGDDQKIGLNLFRIIEPETWCKVVNRVSGANFGNIYCGCKINGYRKVELPKGHTWKSYTKLLLETLPFELSVHYKKRFIKFMRYWNKTGCPIPSEREKDIPNMAFVSKKISNRGKKDKFLLKYKSIPDTLEGNFEAKKLAPSWRRMATCILKNDHLCKTLSFTQTKNQQAKIKSVLEKYQNL